MYRLIVATFFVLATFLVLMTTATPNVFSADNIRVTGFGAGRNTLYLLADANGGPPPGFTFPIMSRIYYALQDEGKFGTNGTVSCDVAPLSSLMSFVTKGSLVDENDNLLFDVFFGVPMLQSLTDEEATELAEFVTKGGVLYISGTGSNSGTSPKGSEYNLVFEKLGLTDRFSETEIFATGKIDTEIPIESVVTKGPFGNVGAITINAYRDFNNHTLRGIISKDNPNEYVAYEKKIGNGYLIATGSPFFTNGAIIDNGNSLLYFLNMFALGCGEQDFGKYDKVVLDVPSFKQGIFPYDDIDPYWESYTYDHGDYYDLLCDTNKDGATMAECACAVTSATMVMNKHGVTVAPDGETPVWPGVVNAYASGIIPGQDNGYSGYSFGNFIWSYAENFSAISANYNNNNKVITKLREEFNTDRIKELIDQGIPVIQKVVGKFGIHWVVIKGYDPDNSRLIINDPAYPDPPDEYTYLDEKYTPASGKSMVIYEHTSSDFRRLQFVTESTNQLLLTNELGQKTGFNLETGKIVEHIPNSEYIFDQYYGDATSEVEIPPTTNGVYFLTLKLPQDTRFSLQIISQDDKTHPVQIYSSDTEGHLAGQVIMPTSVTEKYEVDYNEEIAGSQVNLARYIPVQLISKYSTNSNGAIPVRVLSSPGFDPKDINQDTIRFGATGEEESLEQCLYPLVDFNYDGIRDLTCLFDGSEVGNVFDEFVLKANTASDKHFISKYLI